MEGATPAADPHYSHTLGNLFLQIPGESALLSLFSEHWFPPSAARPLSLARTGTDAARLNHKAHQGDEGELKLIISP